MPEGAQVAGAESPWGSFTPMGRASSVQAWGGRLESYTSQDQGPEPTGALVLALALPILEAGLWEGVTPELVRRVRRRLVACCDWAPALQGVTPTTFHQLMPIQGKQRELCGIWSDGVGGGPQQPHLVCKPRGHCLSGQDWPPDSSRGAKVPGWLGTPPSWVGLIERKPRTRAPFYRDWTQDPGVASKPTWPGSGTCPHVLLLAQWIAIPPPEVTAESLFLSSEVACAPLF